MKIKPWSISVKNTEKKISVNSGERKYNLNISKVLPAVNDNDKRYIKTSLKSSSALYTGCSPGVLLTEHILGDNSKK